MQLVPGVHQISFKAVGSGTTNLYLLEGPEGHILVDSGWGAPGVWEKIQEQLSQAHLNPKDISQIVLTHAHIDHVGLAPKFRSISGAKVIMNPLEAAFLDCLLLSKERLRRMEVAWIRDAGVSEPEAQELANHFIRTRKIIVEVPPVDRLVNDGDTISNGRFQLSVLLTPGHSIGHFCLYEPDAKLLFSGDHVVPKVMTYVGADRSCSNPASEFVDYLLKIHHLTVDLVCPAHGWPFTGFRHRIDHLLEKIEKIQREIMHILAAGPATPYQVASRLTQARDGDARTFRELGHFDRRRTLSDTISHLELLRSKGIVDQSPQNGHMVYVLVE